MNHSSISATKNASSSPKGYLSKTELIVWSSFFGLVSVFVVVSNVLTIFLFATSKSLRKKSFFLMINLAFVDLLLGALCSTYIYFKLWKSSFNIGFQTVDTFFSQASLISAAFISGERLYAIWWPFKHRTLNTRSYLTLILITWLLSLAVTAAIMGTYLVSYSVAFYLFVPYACILTIFICGCYIGVSIKFKFGRISTQHQHRAAQEKRLTKTIMKIVFVTLVCWLPLVIMGSIRYSLEDNLETIRLVLFVTILNYGNSFANPIIYSLTLPEFRQALRACTCRRQQVTCATPVNQGRRRAVNQTPTASFVTCLNPMQLQEVCETKL